MVVRGAGVRPQRGGQPRRALSALRCSAGAPARETLARFHAAMKWATPTTRNGERSMAVNVRSRERLTAGRCTLSNGGMT